MQECWNYITMNNINWNTSDMDWQLKILKKYYPIGMQVEFWENAGDPLVDPLIRTIDMNRSHKYIIVEYIKIVHYVLNVYDPITCEWFKIHPGFFRPTNKYLRVKKLIRVLHINETT